MPGAQGSTDLSASEEQTSSTVSPRAESSKSAPEEFSVEPHPPGTAAEASTQAHPPDSPPLELVDPAPPEQPPQQLEAPPEQEPPEQDIPQLKRKPLPKVNAIAREVHLKATGARHGAGAGIRELFTESTTTVLIFEKGAVIRLSAAVTPSQLLVLTNEETKRELVAHVVRKRTFRPKECYVEVEFAEPAPGFWGVEFSAATALLPKDEKEAAAIEMVAGAETTADDITGAAPQPNADEVQALKKEVEALRGQPVMPAVPPAPPAPNTAPASADQSLAPRTFRSKSLPIDDGTEPVRPPSVNRGPATPANQAPVAKPAMDFQYSLPKGKRSSRARGQFTPGFRAGMLRLTVLLLILGGLIGVAWYKNLLPWMNGPRAFPVTPKASTAPPPVAPRPAAPASSEAPAAKPAGANDTATSTTPAATPQNAASPNAAQPESAAANNAPTAASAPVEPAAQPVRKAKPAPAAPPTKRSSAHSPTTTPVDSAAISAQQPGLVPPKLIKSVAATVSLDELRDFERGDVVIDAVVDATGQVTTMNVLSGPPSLHRPAMEALKKYKYEPATLNGKPVPAHVTAKIHFRYE